ncbi:MAG TPA: cell division protein FtsA [Candidatus Saccharimonadales bacterium]|jgi:cell division protein FtsA|nr:cell division protein FtsA [Candidatus Saccharimonadales bacterium]
MQEQARYAVGLDVGTTTVRCVVGHIDGTGAPTIVGVGEAPNNGMRKGTVVNIVNTAQAIDKALEVAERMSGYQVNEATVSINGSHVIGMSSRGVIAIAATGHEIDGHDLARVEEAATVMQLPANREILEVTPRAYQLDGQDNIKDPLGMTGVRLEVDAHVITALSPNVKNLLKACELTQTRVRRPVLAGIAAAKIGLSQQLLENGVVLIDIGGTTTNIAVYEEGDLQHVSVLPVGSVNITNDLAIGLKTDLSVAEEIKLKHVALGRDGTKDIEVTVGKEKLKFSSRDVDEIVEARCEEIFEIINKELKSIGRAAKLPGGVVLCGGGSLIHGLADFAKNALQLPARVVKISGFAGMQENINSPAFATVLGLMMLDLENESHHAGGDRAGSENVLNTIKDLGGKFSHLLGRFKS